METQPEVPAATPTATPKKKSRKWLWICLLTPPALLVIAFFTLPYLMAYPQPCKNACINNLRQIDGAKEQWALENKKSTGALVTKEDEAAINKFIAGSGPGLKCPSGDPNAHYIFNAVDAAPTCTFNKTPGEVHAL